MKITLLSFLLIVSCLLPALSGEMVERVLTLEESIDTGLHNSQGLLSYREQVAIAQEMVKEAGAQIYPKIDFNLGVSKFNNDFPTVLAPSFNSEYLPAQNMDAFYSTRLSLWQYLYANGRYSTNLRLAETNLSQANSMADIERNRVILDVKKSYYACVTLKEKIKACETAINSIKEITQKNPSARSRWSYTINSMSFTLSKLKHEYEKQKLKHLETIGLELDMVIEISGELSPPTDEYDLNKCLAWAKNYRPELRQTQFQETIDSLRVNLSLAERYPTVTLGANYERLGDNSALDMTNWNATINVNVPIFDGWASWSRIRQRKLQAREGVIRRSAMEDRVFADVREAYMDYGFWKGRVAELNAVREQDIEPDNRLDTELQRLDTMEQALSSQACLEWAIGKVFFK